MTANIRHRDNERIPHTCIPYRLWGWDARPGDLRECDHGRIWIWKLAGNTYVWSEIERKWDRRLFKRAQRALDRMEAR